MPNKRHGESQLASNTFRKVSFGQSSWKVPSNITVSYIYLVMKMVNKNLELVFIDKQGKWYPLDEVKHEDLAAGLEKISKEVAKRLQLVREQR